MVAEPARDVTSPTRRRGQGSRGMARADREREILDAATEAFGHLGYAHVSVADVGRAADVSKPLIYDYFGSKDALYVACLDRAGTNLVERVRESQHGVTVDRALDTLRAFFEALEPRRADWRMLNDRTLPADSLARRRARSYRYELVGLASEGTQAVLADHALNESRRVDLATRVWMSSVTAAIEWWLDRPEISADEMADICADLLGMFARPSEEK